MRAVILFSLILADFRLVNILSSSMAYAAGARPFGGSAGGSVGGGSSSACRCAPDQFEAVLRSVEREIDPQAANRENEESAILDDELENMSRTSADAGDATFKAHDNRNLHIYPGSLAAESESITFVYYDFSAGLLATVDHATRARMIVNHAAGIQYDISPEGSCRRSKIEHRMKKMCQPDEATVTARFSLGLEQPVVLWKFVGPNNSTLRTLVDRKRCVPIYEETFSVVDGYITTASTIYSNVKVGIRDIGVFSPPPACLNIADDHPEILNSEAHDGEQRQ